MLRAGKRLMSLVTSPSSAGVSLPAISSTLRSWSDETAAGRDGSMPVEGDACQWCRPVLVTLDAAGGFGMGAGRG